MQGLSACNARSDSYHIGRGRDRAYSKPHRRGAAMIDLANKGIQCLLYALLDEISDTARATNRGRMSARLLGRALALRIGLPVWECQRVAKAWKRRRHPVGGRTTRTSRETTTAPHCTEQAEMQ